jgi:siroheme synthase-like protein
MTDGHSLYPVSLDLHGRAVLVVGGGPVAARKVAALVSCGARVTVVAPDVDDALAVLVARGESDAGSVEIRRRPYRRGEARDYRLVLTATGVPEVDGAVSADAEAAGVWVNSADDAARCTFVLPSVHRDGQVTVAVSTGGASPALAAWLRRRIAASLGPGLDDLAALLHEARDRVRQAGGRTEDLEWQVLLDGPLPRLVAEGRTDEARALLDELMVSSGVGDEPDRAAASGLGDHPDRAGASGLADHQDDRDDQ